MQDWFHSILEFLYKENSFNGQPVILNDFLVNRLNIENDKIEKISQLIKVLNLLRDNGLIIWDSKSLVPGRCVFGEDNIILSNRHKWGGTLEFNHVEATLTLDGYSYFLKRERENEIHISQLETNKSTKTLNDTVLPNNFASQRLGNRWSRGLAAISIVFISCDCYSVSLR